jgi:hypothetical protein
VTRSCEKTRGHTPHAQSTASSPPPRAFKERTEPCRLPCHLRPSPSPPGTLHRTAVDRNDKKYVPPTNHCPITCWGEKKEKNPVQAAVPLRRGRRAVGASIDGRAADVCGCLLYTHALPTASVSNLSDPSLSPIPILLVQTAASSAARVPFVARPPWRRRPTAATLPPPPPRAAPTVSSCAHPTTPPPPPKRSPRRLPPMGRVGTFHVISYCSKNTVQFDDSQ